VGDSKKNNFAGVFILTRKKLKIQCKNRDFAQHREALASGIPVFAIQAVPQH
jgi:hypothetical protein